MGTFLKIIDH